MTKFDIIYADPPWNYKGQKQHTRTNTTGGAASHYSTLTTKEMMTWDIPEITAENALLFMWSSSPHLDQAIALMKAWKFAWATVAFVWDKQRVNPGFYTMSQCELCLVGKRGRIPQPRGSRNIRQLVSEMRTTHSTKPEAVALRIEKMFPTQRKLEIFARKPREGWSVWGNEVDSITWSPCLT